MTTKAKTAKAAKKPTKGPAKKAPSGDEALAKKLNATLKPGKVLEKQKVTDAVLWRLLVNDLVKLEHALAICASNRMDGLAAEPVITVAKRLPPETMTDRGAREVLRTSYNDHASAWERVMGEMPDVVNDILAPHRVRNGSAIPDEVRDRVLAYYTKAAFDPANTISYLETLVEPLQARSVWSRRLLDMIAANPELPVTEAAVAAFKFATFDQFHAYCVRNYQAARGPAWIGVLTTLDYTAQQLHAFRLLGGALASHEAWEILEHAFVRGEVAPVGVEDAVVEDMATSWTTLDNAVSLHSLPKQRYEAFVTKVRALAQRRPELAGILRDDAYDNDLVDGIVGAATGEWSEMHDNIMTALRDLLPAQLHAITLMERAYAKIEKSRVSFDHTYEGTKLRNLFRRVKFMATRGQKQRPFEMVMPSDEIAWADHVGEMIGADDATKLMPLADMKRLLDAYIPYDWDDSLRFENYFDDRVEKRIQAIVRPPIETRPWAELAKLVAQTSFKRLEEGEEEKQTLTTVLSRPEPLAERIAVVVAIAEREALYAAANPGDMRGLRAVMAALGALAPHVIAAKQPLPDVLADVALRILREDAPETIRDLLLALPRKQVDGWLHALSTDRKPAVKKRAKEYAKLVQA